MANHRSAEKRNRQNTKRRTQNAATRASVRTAIKSTQALIGEGKLDEAQKSFRAATRLLDKAAIHGLYHKNTAKRHISRLAGQLNTAS